MAATRKNETSPTSEPPAAETPTRAELALLRAALDNVEQGVILLDANLRASFINRAARRLWRISDQIAETRPPYLRLVGRPEAAGQIAPTTRELNEFILRRLAFVHAGRSTPIDLPVRDGRVIRSYCSVLPDGSRMLTYSDVSDLVQHAEQLKHIASTDALTGIYNRRHFLEVAEVEWERFQRYHRPLSLLMLDIDHFKSINDRFGHDVGDLAIMHMATLCKEHKRTTDVLARVGGEEFCILLPEADAERAHKAADRLRQIIAATPFTAGATTVTITVSMGLAEATLSMSGVEALMKQADLGLYAAKAGGRNCTAEAPAPAAPPERLAAE